MLLTVLTLKYRYFCSVMDGVMDGVTDGADAGDADVIIGVDAGVIN